MERRHGFGLPAVAMAVAATALLADGHKTEESGDRDGEDGTVEIEIVLTED
ncbi:hypothetical protein I7X12_03075 [Halosimplex litoreum]|uniref:Uncharacterized protein n=1 Tax=Halosimplex litoreum TaxID=1198301 RepID=A0A7T3KVR3_9EURY|nr:hypothetical protein [Halosimplex litoreum]QPV63629.1 hypothetical protein I7X12_03075 [Halosimplex litoreum]